MSRDPPKDAEISRIPDGRRVFLLMENATKQDFVIVSAQPNKLVLADPGALQGCLGTDKLRRVTFSPVSEALHM